MNREYLGEGEEHGRIRQCGGRDVDGRTDGPRDRQVLRIFVEDPENQVGNVTNHRRRFDQGRVCNPCDHCVLNSQQGLHVVNAY